MAQVAVIGAGAWGTTLAKLLAERGERPRLWSWQSEHAAAMARDRENKEFFPGVQLPASVYPTADLGAALDGADLVVLVVPAQAFRATLLRARPYLPSDAVLVSATKGIETDSHMLMTEVIQDVLGSGSAGRSSCLSGPSFAQEVAVGHPTNVVVASSNHELSVTVQQRIGTARFRVYSSDDPIGVQMGGALKNVIAIAAGACDGLGFGSNTRAALITRGIAEISRLAVARGADARTLAGLAGVGDLVLTCTGELSRNRAVGFQLGSGRRLCEALESLGHVAEGVPTAKSAYFLAQQQHVDLPICTEVYRVLYEGKPPLEAVRDVLARPLRREAE
jgi:glycerol-3-phosphate dehydrogenase (NAD(P)+)